MKPLSKVRHFWHQFMLGYHNSVLEGCLDQTLKTKIKSKIEYHRLRMVED
ncbi:hypothetical protein [Bacillus salacetis]|nr:hypothetical protein [Bacillus salacetis]